MRSTVKDYRYVCCFSCALGGKYSELLDKLDRQKEWLEVLKMKEISWEVLKKQVDDYIQCVECNKNIESYCYMILDSFPGQYLWEYKCKCGLILSGRLKGKIDR